MRDSYSVLYSSPVSTGVLLCVTVSLPSSAKVVDPRVIVGIGEPVILVMAILPPMFKPIVAEILWTLPDSAMVNAAIL